MQTHGFQIWIIIQFFLNVDVQLQYINYISNYLASPRCIVLVFLPKRTFCFLSSSACSLLQHLGVYLDERNYNCISNKQHQNKIHSPQRKRNEIIYINFNSTARFWNDLKEASWAKYPLFCEMMWSCKCFINWKKHTYCGRSMWLYQFYWWMKPDYTRDNLRPSTSDCQTCST